MTEQKISPFQIDTSGATDGQIFTANSLSGGMSWSDSTQTIGIAAFGQANAAINIAQSAFAQANAGGGTTVGAAFDRANSAQTIAIAAFAQANAGNVTTVNATSQSFTANGTATNFILSTNVSSQNNIIVSINGLIQIPITHYSITGNTLTFTDAPIANSKIEARSVEGVALVSGGGGGYSGASRSNVSGTTASLANLANGNITVSGYKSYILYKIATSCEAWVRVYTDSTSRTADASRSIGTDPLPGSGVIGEVLTTTGYLTQLITPGIIGFNNDSTPTTNVYMTVTNYNTYTQAVTVTLTLTQMEV